MVVRLSPLIYFNPYAMKLNLKAICLFEQIRDKSFADIDMELEEDVVAISYSLYIESTSTVITFEQFQESVLSSEEAAESILNPVSEALRYANQTIMMSATVTPASRCDAEENVRISNIAGSLIINGCLSPHYVMREMDLWELPIYHKAIEDNRRERMEEKRMWTYLSMAPHIDTDKIDSPKKLYAFPWEEETSRQEREKELEEGFAIISALASE